MNRRSMICCSLPLALLAGCAGDLTPLDGAGDDAERAALAAGFTWNTAALVAIPAGTIPATRLPLGAFADREVASRLIQTVEPYSQTGGGAGHPEFDSTSWHFGADGGRGLVLAVQKGAPGTATAQSEPELQANAIARLKSWGIGAGELGAIWQRRLLGTVEEAGVAGPPTRMAYKTFVNRAVLGVRVDGHRAVVTQGLDGSFRRALVKWPALAAVGHLLHTPLTIAQIKSRAAAALGAVGITSGAIQLRWKLAPTTQPNGEVVLKLMVAARTAAAVAADQVTTEEAQEFDVDVNPIP